MNTRWMAAILEEYGYKIIEDVEVKDLTDKYMNPTGRNLASTPI